MKYELSANFEKPEGWDELLQPYNLIQQKISELTKQLHNKREEQVIERLKELGYTFNSKQELHEFVKTRLTMVHYEDKPQWRELLLDGNLLIASWWETVDMENDGVKMTITMGKHPSQCGWGFSKFASTQDQ